MNRVQTISLVLPTLLFLLVSACTTPTPTTSQKESDSPTTREAIAQLVATNSGNAEAQADAILAKLTLEQKVGQVMVIGFDGKTYDPRCRDVVERLHIGNVILFARNIESPAQTAQLTNDLQASALAHGGLGMLIAIDQEGGRVTRLTAANGFTEFPGAMALGATAKDVQEAAGNVRRAGEIMAKEMRAVGINVDFAPDLDVNNNPSNPVIGVRSYSSDPHRVAILGTAFIEGLQSGGVLAFGKHFPGHGDTGTDSHVSLPTVIHERARLEAVEFVPFKAAIAANVAGIMSAHISFPTIEPSPGLPATLSPKVLTELLRNELGYKGLIVTDSLEMGALAKQGYPSERGAVHALIAGADLLLFNAGHKMHEAAHRGIIEGIRNGKVPMARLNEAVRRVLINKAKLGALQPAPVDVKEATRFTGAPAHKAVSEELTRKAITLVADPAKLLPLSKAAKPIVIGLPTVEGLAAALGGIDAGINTRPKIAEINDALGAIRKNPGATVILTLAGASANKAQSDLAKAVLETGAPVVIVALREPYDLLPNVTGISAKTPPTLIATYGHQPNLVAPLAAVLKGETKPNGHLSVDLPDAFPIGTGMTEFARQE